MPATDQTPNLLGALARVVADRTADAVADETSLSDSQSAALAAMYHFLDRPSIDLLGQVLGLSSSGTVRLVDRLEAAGQVRRGSGPDGRSTAVSLTAGGRRVAAKVEAARARILEQCLVPLDGGEREVLNQLMGKMMGGLVRSPGATRWICRFCDTGACGRDRGLCPAANAALDQMEG